MVRVRVSRSESQFETQLVGPRSSIDDGFLVLFVVDFLPE